MNRNISLCDHYICYICVLKHVQSENYFQTVSVFHSQNKTSPFCVLYQLHLTPSYR